METDNLNIKNSAVNGTDDLEARPNCRIAFYTKSRSEKKLAIDFTKEKIKAYVPVQTIEKQWSERKKMVYVAVIPMVAFVNITSKEELLMIKQDYRVVRVLTYPGSRKPAIIPECQIEILRFMLRRLSHQLNL